MPSGSSGSGGSVGICSGSLGSVGISGAGDDGCEGLGKDVVGWDGRAGVDVVGRVLISEP